MKKNISYKTSDDFVINVMKWKLLKFDPFIPRKFLIRFCHKQKVLHHMPPGETLF